MVALDVEPGEEEPILFQFLQNYSPFLHLLKELRFKGTGQKCWFHDYSAAMLKPTIQALNILDLPLEITALSEHTLQKIKQDKTGLYRKVCLNLLEAHGPTFIVLPVVGEMAWQLLQEYEATVAVAIVASLVSARALGVPMVSMAHLYICHRKKLLSRLISEFCFGTGT